MILKPLKTETRKFLTAAGASPQDFVTVSQQFDVMDFLVPMEQNIPGTKTRLISAKKQREKLQQILDKPLSNYCVGISSYPSDLRAKQLAHQIMALACTEFVTNRKLYMNKTAPVWHKVYGGLKDKLRDDKSTEKPCMVVISNVSDEMTTLKVEKIRDILEMYHDVPRIVVSGGMPTCDLFAFRLNFTASAFIYIGPQNLLSTKVV